MDAREDQLIGSFYQAVTAPDVWPVALEQFRALFDAQAAILGIYDPAAHGIALSFSAGIWTSDVMDRYARDFAKIDPAIGRFAAAPTGRAVSTETLLAWEERRVSAFYNEFLRPLDLADCLGARLLDINGGYSALAAHCAPKRGPFSNEDVALLERLVPHATRAFQLRRTFALLDMKATVLATVVDRLPVGLIARDREQRIIHVNRAARQILARRDGLWQEDKNSLRANDRAADQRLLALQRTTHNGGAGGIVRVPREHTTRTYAVLVASLPAGTGLAGAIGEGRSGTLILIHDPETKTATPTQALAAMYGLSPRGAELAAALAAGEELKDFAERNGISMYTVRFHLKGLFAAVGVRSQAELVRGVVRALAELNLGRREPRP